MFTLIRYNVKRDNQISFITRVNSTRKSVRSYVRNINKNMFWLVWNSMFFDRFKTPKMLWFVWKMLIIFYYQRYYYKNKFIQDKHNSYLYFLVNKLFYIGHEYKHIQKYEKKQDKIYCETNSGQCLYYIISTCLYVASLIVCQ